MLVDATPVSKPSSTAVLSSKRGKRQECALRAADWVVSSSSSSVVNLIKMNSVK